MPHLPLLYFPCTPGLFLLVIRRALRNAPLTLAILAGLLVRVTLLVAAPLYTAALADVGLRATLADAPLDQRSVRAAMPARRLDRGEHARLDAAVRASWGSAGWLKPIIFGAVWTKRLQLPGTTFGHAVTLVETETALENLRVVEGRLPQSTAGGEAVEVVLGRPQPRDSRSGWETCSASPSSPTARRSS